MTTKANPAYSDIVRGGVNIWMNKFDTPRGNYWVAAWVYKRNIYITKSLNRTPTVKGSKYEVLEIINLSQKLHAL